MHTQLETPDSKLETYTAALQLIAHIQARLSYGRPFYTRSGARLTELDQVVHAILADDLSSSSLDPSPGLSILQAGEGQGTQLPSPSGRGDGGEGICAQTVR